MKKQTNILNSLNSQELFNLTIEVKETVALNVNTKNSLKAIDFWYMHRTQKSKGCGRHMGISVR